ncbi:MAG: hypothetical protein ACE5L6_02045 [Candidatus Bathyarchaeia archaeon]
MPLKAQRTARIHYQRYIFCVFGKGNLTSNVGAAGVLGLVPIQVQVPLIVDRLGHCATAVAANSQVKGGIYRDNGDLPDGAALICQTAAELEVAGKNELAIPDTLLMPGLYWAGIEWDRAGSTYLRSATPYQTIGTLIPHYFVVPGGFAADLPTPCPVTLTTNTFPSTFLRVKAVKPVTDRMEVLA